MSTQWSERHGRTTSSRTKRGPERVLADRLHLPEGDSSYIARDLAEWLEDKGLAHIRGAQRHPQSQGKIERWGQTLKNRILLEHCYMPGAVEEQVGVAARPS